ncbi:MAG: MGMT family protein [bacterium]|nr:MGMT family protein [bacterium]
MTKFSQQVVYIVRQIPKGQVVSYSQVAAYVGLPRAARQVGWTLRQAKVDLPWWRVINNSGRVSIKGNWQYDAQSQRQRLLKEKVQVKPDLSLDITKYRFVASQEQLRKWGLPSQYRQMIWAKFKSGY